MITLKYMKEFLQPKTESKIIEKKKEKIKHKEIAELREPIQELLLQLKEKIDSGEYNLIIGDDASGRIPTLIFERILRNVYREKGFKLPDTIFVAGSGSRRAAIEQEGKTQKLNELFDKYKKGEKTFKSERKENLDKIKALVITDTIETGTSLRPLSNALKQNRIDFDIATIGKWFPLNWQKEREKRLGGKIYWGEGGGAPMIYQRASLSGVFKEPEEVFAKPLKGSSMSFAFGGDEKIQKEIEEARKDARILAEELIGWYKKVGS